MFEGVDANFAKNASALRDEGKAVFIVAGESYGQGSSREHAAICPMFLGVRAVIAKSFERIHAANLVNFGILPLVFADTGEYNSIEKGHELEIDAPIGTLKGGKEIMLYDKTSGKTMRMNYSLSERQKAILKAGGLLNYTKGKK